jgi:hypothetical protein
MTEGVGHRHQLLSHVFNSFFVAEALKTAFIMRSACVRLKIHGFIKLYRLIYVLFGGGSDEGMDPSLAASHTFYLSRDATRTDSFMATAAMMHYRMLLLRPIHFLVLHNAETTYCELLTKRIGGMLFEIQVCRECTPKETITKFAAYHLLKNLFSYFLPRKIISK